jgi:hypothetical protein
MRTRRVFGFLFLSATVAISAGCATIAHGLRQDIYITSAPAGAMVSLGTKTVGPTPTVVSVWRNSSPTLRFESNGFETLTISLKRVTSNWLAGDFVALNPVSCQGLNRASACPGLLIANAAMFFGIDFLTGAAFKFPKEVRAVLRKK